MGGAWSGVPASDVAVYAIGLALIAAVYIGFSVANGRGKMIVVETLVAGAFVAIAAWTGRMPSGPARRPP